jgi:hypothetical protein
MSGIEPGHDDELRRRLHDIPAAGARLDTDAIIAGARKRRRPKTIALSSAATVAGVLIVAPFVAPGLSPLQPTGMSTVSDSGAAPESAQEPAEQPAPDAGESGAAEQDESGAADAGEGEGGASGDQGAPGDTGASGDSGAAGSWPADARTLPLEPAAAWCGLPQAGDAGLALMMLDPPQGSGFAAVELTNIGTRSVALEVEPVIAFEIENVSGRIAGGEAASFALAPGASAVLGAPTAVLPAGVCGDGTPSAEAPVVIVQLDGGEPFAVVGTPIE